ISVADGLVLLHVSSYQFRTGGSATVLDLRDGRRLWRQEFKPKELYTQGSQRPVLRNGQVVMLDGTGVYRYDARTGEPIGEPLKRPKNLKRRGRRNGACTASRATVDWLMANAWLYVGPDGLPQINQGARGACGQGVVPANGLVFVPPTPCDCGDYLRGLLALAPTEPGSPIKDDQRLTSGVAAPNAQPNGAAFQADWPIYLGDSQRRSFVKHGPKSPLKPAWTARLVEPRNDDLTNDRRNSERFLGALSGVTVGGGLVVASALESHAVIAADARTGKVRWTFPTPGKVDSPPTLSDGAAVFGCDDGCVRALRLSDGKLMWRCRIGPRDGLALNEGHL
ncbi:MAG: PQQ-binding-like beta-propeller repeat protein, partial [Planctomycetales bacterium]